MEKGREKEEEMTGGGGGGGGGGGKKGEPSVSLLCVSENISRKCAKNEIFRTSQTITPLWWHKH